MRYRCKFFSSDILIWVLDPIFEHWERAWSSFIFWEVNQPPPWKFSATCNYLEQFSMEEIFIKFWWHSLEPFISQSEVDSNSFMIDLIAIGYKVSREVFMILSLTMSLLKMWLELYPASCRKWQWSWCILLFSYFIFLIKSAWKGRLFDSLQFPCRRHRHRCRCIMVSLEYLPYY